MNEREYKVFAFEVKQINEDDDFFTFEGFASTFGNIDLGDDIVQAGAFQESLKNAPNVPILWQHNMGQPIGKSIHLEEQAKGLFVRARLPKSDTLVSGRVMPQMKAESINSMSIGFFIQEFSMSKETNIRTLEKIKLFEISLVTLPMNTQATITDFKSFKEEEIKSIKDIETILKKGGLSQKEAKTFISKTKEFSKDQRDADDSDETKEQRDVVSDLSKIMDLQQDHKLKQIINLIQK